MWSVLTHPQAGWKARQAETDAEGIRGLAVCPCIAECSEWFAQSEGPQQAPNRAGDVGNLSEATSELQASLDLSDSDIDTLIAQRTEARKTRSFAKADAIRNDLAAKGILLEDSKDGARWKRK
jgi:cysteinyl-tRNA synthetase